MIRVLNENLCLVIEGTFIEVLKKNFQESIELGEKNALSYYEFCNYLIENDIKISTESLLDTIYMDYGNSIKIEIITDENNNSQLDFWDEYYKYLIKKCVDIYEFIKISNDHDIKVDVGNLDDFDFIHTLNNDLKVSYKENKFYLIR